MNNNISVDDKKLINALSNLSYQKMNKAYRNAMRESLKPIVKETKSQLKSSGIKNTNKKYVSKKTGKISPSMQSGIKTSINLKNEDEAYGKVHIMGEFRLKYFEKGTNNRKTRKGYDRGSIKPKWFFKKSVNAKGDEAVKSLDENIRVSIIKVWDKR